MSEGMGEGMSEGHVVVTTTRFADDLDVLRSIPGFRLDRIMPADDPAIADVSGHGLSLRLCRAQSDSPLTLQIDGASECETVLLPGGTVIEFVAAPDAADAIEIPPNEPSVVVTGGARGTWVKGRAGMNYRDLLPGRWGGRFIASHIHIPGAGPVPDDVHHHRIRFQIIAVKHGAVEVVYEDQGPPFVMRAGDCVLQPPGIRHRVLHSSGDLEVVEVGCPAEHETLLDHELSLPNGTLHPDRRFDCQRFVRHVAADDGTTGATTDSISSAPGSPAWRIPGWTARDTGIRQATDGLLDVRFARPTGEPSTEWSSLDGEFHLLVVMRGRVTVDVEADGMHALSDGGSVALPAGTAHRLLQVDPRTELLEVHVP